MYEAKDVYNEYINKAKATKENGVAEMTDFQKQFLSKGTGATLFTQKEFDEALYAAQLEIMTIAMETAKKAVLTERDACARIAADAGHMDVAKLIITRLEAKDDSAKPAVPAVD
jgi:uncharacterized LabA/DUF88 family protein